MKVTDYRKLVISKGLAERLVALGLHRIAVWHWYDKTEDAEASEIMEEGQKVWDVGRIANPHEELLPAWTFEELRVMLGNAYGAADFPDPRPQEVDIETVKFLANFPDKQKTYISGAEGTGEIIEFLLTNRQLKPEDCNKRYLMVFKPQ